ncbi:glycoside hydrolase family 2 [Halobacteria archaeon AArc-curdl1]|uniref:beta-mannosidase n=1 Tax=Natronosalvus hydrolyticus TaxID=2979988 RepID=A0AAP3E5H4_9EURY|nr:glycoside hydrolase family 2 [Halobacteria archaeon AArc-curdl1]
MAGKWMAAVADSSSGMERPTAESWVPVSVPGRPLELLEGDFDIDHLLENPILYRTTIGAPQVDTAERTRFAFHGAHGLTRAWINGTEHELEESPSYFEPTRLEFDADEEVELRLEFDPTRSPGGVFGAEQVPASHSLPGLWWGADLEVRPATFIRRIRANPRVDLDDGTAEIEVELEVDIGPDDPLDDSITLSLRPEGFRGGGSMDRVAVSGAPGTTQTVSTTLEVRDPKLWWPRGYGSQHRYTVRVKLGADSTEQAVGLRQVDWVDDELHVNGERVRARGLTRLPGTDPADDVDWALEANANLLRVRGHVPRPELYRACDEAGILLWQELPISGATFDAEQARPLLESVLAHYGSHPSLGLMGVQNESTDPFEKPLGSGRLARAGFRWRAWRASCDDHDAQTVSANVPDDLVAIPVTGAPGLGAMASTLSPGWQYLEAADIDWLLERYPHLGSLVGAFGAASISGDVDPASVPGVDSAVFNHRISDGDSSLALQARILETVADGLRRRSSSILVASSLRDVAPGGGTGIVAHDGEPKPAFEALKAVYELVTVLFESRPAAGTTVSLVVVNDTDNPLEVPVRWQAGTADDEVTIAVDSHGRAGAGTAAIPADADAITVALETPTGPLERKIHL